MHSSTNGKHNVTEDIIHEYNSLKGIPACDWKEALFTSLKNAKKWTASSPRNGIRKKCSINTLPLSPTIAGKSYLPQNLQHSLTECNSCPSFFPALTRAFPGRKSIERNAVEIAITARPHLQIPPAKLARKVGWDIVTQLVQRANRAVSGWCFTKYPDSWSN